MLFQHFDWDLTHQVLFLYIYFAQPSYKLKRPALENAHTLLHRTDIFSCKFSVKVSFMLDNPSLVPSLCKLNQISLCFMKISTKSPAKLLIPFRESTGFFWSPPQCFGSLSEFQHNIKISIKTAHVSRQSVSCEYGFTNIWQNFISKDFEETIITSNVQQFYETSQIVKFVDSSKIQQNIISSNKKVDSLHIKNNNIAINSFLVEVTYNMNHGKKYIFFNITTFIYPKHSILIST